MDKFGIKFIKENEDPNSKNYLDFIINSTNKTLMNRLIGNISYTFSSNPAVNTKTLLATIPHNSNYIPMVTIKCSTNGTDWSMLDYIYFMSNLVCPSCQTRCSDNSTYCENIAWQKYNDCLDAYPYVYPDRWDEWVAGCDSQLLTDLEICSTDYDMCMFSCEYPLSKLSRTLYKIIYTVDKSDVKIWLDIKGNYGTECSDYPAGSFVDMTGVKIDFKYNISFTELKKEGTKNEGKRV